MFTFDYSNYTFQPSISIVLIVLSFFSLTSPALSQGYKPHAVVMALDRTSAPNISEQILLHNLRKELSRSFDLSKQSAFEIALQKLESSGGGNYCLYLNCILELLATFPKTSLFLLKTPPGNHRLTLALIGENRSWRVKHELCNQCSSNYEDYLKSLVLRMESYARPPMVFENTKAKTVSSLIDRETLKNKTSSVKTKNKKTIFWPETKSRKEIERLGPKIKLPLDELQFKIAQRRYNQLIWSKIKKDLMFFRQKNRNPTIKNLKARLRLQIDPTGKVVDRRLLKASGSQKFDKSILDSVDLLRLPPPMALLIRNPPYVVTILIQP